jgi:predicted ATPase
MLTRLYAHNYRCFVNFELRPGPNSLLLGYNGVGKTSVFHVLGAIQDLIVWNKEASEAFPSDTVTFFGEGTQQRFELDVQSPHGPMRYALVLEHDVEHETATIVSEDVFWLGGPLGSDRVYGFAHGEVHLSGSDEPVGVRTFPFTGQRSYLSSVDKERANPRLLWFLRFIEQIWILKLNPQNTHASAKRDELFLERDGTNFPSWCRHLLLESRHHVEAAEEQLRQVMPGFRSLNVQAAGRVRVLVARFAPQGARKPVDVDFDMLSDGQRALIILYIVLHAVRDNAKLLCFDEPDNYVSIREIQPFLIELANAADDHGIQTLIVSHSSEVIDFLGASNALLLERPDGGQARIGTISLGPGLKLSEQMARGWHVTP